MSRILVPSFLFSALLPRFFLIVIGTRHSLRTVWQSAPGSCAIEFSHRLNHLVSSRHDPSSCWIRNLVRKFDWHHPRVSSYPIANLLFILHFSIVFVHGFRGHRTETWSKGNICWPRDLLPNEGALSNTRILSFGYDSTVVGPSGHTRLDNLFDHSVSLINGLCQNRKQNAVSCNWYKLFRYVYILHSAL
jgi:hypothetical protein